MFEKPRRGRQARNFTKLTLGAPASVCVHGTSIKAKKHCQHTDACGSFMHRLNMGFQCILTLKLTFSLLARQVLRSVSLEMLTPDIDILAIHQIRGK